MACVFTLLLQSSYLFFYFRGLVVQIVVSEHTAKLNTRTHTRHIPPHTTKVDARPSSFYSYTTTRTPTTTRKCLIRP